MAAILAATLFGACECEPTETPPPVAPVGQLTVRSVDGGFDLVLGALERPVRSLQVDVALTGAVATAARALGTDGQRTPDVLEAGLGAPKADFTVVVADTRRLNLPSGPVVRVDTDAAPGSIALARALAVDDTGAKRTVTVVVP